MGDATPFTNLNALAAHPRREPENKRRFGKILHEFIDRHPFNPVPFPSEPATETSDST